MEFVWPVVLEQIVRGYAQPDEFDKLAQFDLKTVLLTASRCGRVDCIRDLLHYARQFASTILVAAAEKWSCFTASRVIYSLGFNN